MTFPYLASTEIIDWHTPAVRKCAKELAADSTDPLTIAERCFHFVRDRIQHSSDYRRSPTTCTASEVLAAGTGFCYAKSHLLAALLRANGIPTGLCYQRLTIDGNGPPFCLHGLNAVKLPGHSWYRIDARGNRADVDAQFTPPIEKLAFPIVHEGECDLPGVYAEPLPKVIKCLRTYPTWEEVLENLPDTHSG